ncbi:rod shape-determining protein MreD [Shimia biformata]|uniref:rod shape-determining protein MreD n=1 Tax=Shimia biformata TaxID=1294299 RepID=UPI0019526B39|nr:rod shape-determining protein MreD [Shimia biformata]
MASPMSRVWAMRLLFLGLGVGVIFLSLLPLETTPRRWAGPDFLVLFTVAWTIRRPDYVPALSIAVLFLLADFLFLRPPGAFTAIMVVAGEFLRRRALFLRDATFMTDWLAAAGAIAGITIAYRFFLAVFLVGQVPLGLTLIQMIMSIIFYPFVVLISRVAFGLRKAVPGDLDPAGRMA